jgi:sporulation protein YlmC with PRC-barrel domain
MRMKDLRGLPVIDPTAARKIGTVIDYQLDPATGHLAALDITSAANSDGERVLAHRLRRVGRSAVILTPRGGMTPGTTPEVDPRWLDASTLCGLEVMGDDGNLVGHLADATFNQDSLVIEAYVLRSGIVWRLLGRRARIIPARVQACSRELMLVTSGRVKELELPAAPGEDSATLSLRAPLKADDRLSAPTFDQVPDGQTVGSRSG